ncbi:hypothetical protein HDU85_006409 [Gaertneriomyces sp. JEL0708]|nr:hypothetical protein HDU85_006409 [Gaertneriomyces sp. JEL0708]
MTTDPHMYMRVIHMDRITFTLVKDRRIIIGTIVQGAMNSIFIPLYVALRKERIIRFRHWRVSVMISIMMQIFTATLAAESASLGDAKDVSLPRIRALLFVSLAALHLAAAGFIALIVSHYYLDSSQKLRSLLQTELPAVYHYESSITNSSRASSLGSEDAPRGTKRKTDLKVFEETIAKLRRNNVWCQERRSWLVFTLTALPVMGLDIFVVVSRFGRPHFGAFIVWPGFILAFVAVALVLGFQIPWKMSDNYRIKYQLGVGSTLTAFAFSWGLVNYYSWTPTTEDVLMWVLGLCGPGLVITIIALPAVTALWVHLTEGQNANATLRALLGITTSGGEMETSARSSSVQSTIEKDRRAGSLQPSLMPPVPLPTSTPGTTKDDSTRVGTNPAVVKSSTKNNAKSRGSSTTPARRAVDAILIDPEALNALTKFAALEFCVENLLFISAVDEFRLRCARAKAKDPTTMGASSPFPPGEASSPMSPIPPGSQMPSDRVRYAQRVVADFIKAGSVNEVNIPSQIRREIEETFKECCNNPESILPDSIFDAAYKHVENMLITDIIPRFKKSKLYVEPRKNGRRPV